MREWEHQYLSGAQLVDQHVVALGERIVYKRLAFGVSCCRYKAEAQMSPKFLIRGAVCRNNTVQKANLY